MLSAIAVTLAIASVASGTGPTPKSPLQVARVSSPQAVGDGFGYVANGGQWPAWVKFRYQTGGLDQWVADDGIVLDYHRELDPPEAVFEPPAGPGPDLRPQRRVGHVVAMRFVGGHGRFDQAASDPLPGVFNFLVGDDPALHATKVPHFERATMRDVYPGIDAVYLREEGRPRYDLIVRPGADPARIRLRFDGADGVTVDRDGDLRLDTSIGAVWQRKLRVTQDGVAVPARFERKSDGTVGFQVGGYDRAKPLLIDPLVWSAAITGDGYDQTPGIGTDASGNVYVAYRAGSSDPPTTVGAYDVTPNGGVDAVVLKLSPSGNSLVYATIFGGSGDDSPEDMVVESAGAVIVVGSTSSANLPITSGAAQGSYAGAYDGFVVKLLAGGAALDFATYVGGSGEEYPCSLAVDGLGAIYVAGQTSSSDLLSTVNATFDGTFGGGSYDSFVVKMARTGRSFTWRNYLGGSGIEGNANVACDASNAVYFYGWSESTDLPVTANAWMGSNQGQADQFFGKCSAAGSLQYYTYIGTPGYQNGNGLAVAPDGLATCVAKVQPTTGSIPGVVNVAGTRGSDDLCVLKIRADGNGPVFGMTIGGSADENPHYGRSVVLTNMGGVVMTGISTGSGLPLTPDAWAGYGGSHDGFFVRLSAALDSVVFCTYLGQIANLDRGTSVHAPGKGRYLFGGFERGGAVNTTYVYGSGNWAWDTVVVYDEELRRPLSLYNFGSATIPELAPYTFVAKADGDPDDPAELRFSLNGAPPGATINATSGVFAWTPTEAQGPGEYTFEVVAHMNDGSIDDDYKEITLTVTEVSDNRPPVLDPIGNKSASTGYPLTFTATASDPDAGQSLTYSLIGAPSGAAIGSNSGVFQWTPGTAGSYTLTVRVTDSGSPALFDEETITVTVSNLSVASLTLDPTSVVGGASSSTGTVTLNQGAPQGGVSVTLASTDPTAASVPNAVAVPEGQTAATFEIQTFAVATAKTPTISATRGNTVQSILTVNPPALDALTIAPNPQEGGLSTVGRLTLTGPAPAGGFAVSVSTNSPSLVSFDSGTVTVGAGQTQWNFTVYTQVVEYRRDVSVTATKNGVSKSFVLSLLPPAIRLSVPSSVGPGSISTGTVTVSQVAGSGGTNVTLSGGSGIVTIPSNVTIGSGQTSAAFPITAVGTGTATVTAGLPTGQTASGNITVASGTTVSGTIALNGRSSLVGEELTIQVRQAGTATVLASYTVVIASGNAYSFVTNLSGTHDLSAKFRTSLRKRLASVALGAGRNFSLINGDVNGDDTVNIADFLALRAAFGSSPASANWNRNADLNGDGSVNVSDFLILRAGFGKSGDP
ncbi:MAG: putative Ig domain-containing protein [Fimbriimonadaceae bacterium]|nr:putative Ig domain-containing protein [Fimbriimonadaceae bacterium]